MSLLGLMESWVSKLGSAIGQPEMMSVSDWLKLEKALHNWQSLAENALQNVSIMQTENENKNKPDIQYVFQSVAVLVLLALYSMLVIKCVFFFFKQYRDRKGVRQSSGVHNKPVQLYWWWEPETQWGGEYQPGSVRLSWEVYSKSQYDLSASQPLSAPSISDIAHTIHYFWSDLIQKLKIKRFYFCYYYFNYCAVVYIISFISWALFSSNSCKIAFLLRVLT